ncbi:MAG: glutathione S-transferase [Steroidobacteraceae bacterium]
MITVHHLNNSRSQRILWLLEELGCEYEIRRYQRDPQSLLAPPELRRVHPLGKSPVISNGADIVAESGAIIEYLLDGYGNGRLRPAQGTAERRRYTYWLHYAEGSALTPLLLKLIFSRLPRGPMPFVARPVVKAVANRVQQGYIDPQIKAHADYWESELGKSLWFAGDEFSAADIQMSFPLESAAARAGGQLGDKTRAFLGRIHERPAYQRALQAGGDYQPLA